jgi:hypothetical protein
LYFGSDRFDNSGDAQQGFWFFQNKIGLGTNAVGGGTGFTSSGTGANQWHRNGDLLVISDFSNGGTTATITVYKWDNTCTKAVTKPNPGDCGDINLRLLATSDKALCASTLQQNDNACGIVNPANGTAVPWSTDYTDKSGNHTYLQGELYEGGVNLSLLGLGNECFASVASETRSSTSTTAVLKDFVLGSFGQCGATFATTPKGDTTLSGVSGSASVYDTVSIGVSGTANPPAPTGSVQFYLCGPSTTLISTCDATGTLKSTVDLAGATKNGNAYTLDSNDTAHGGTATTLTASGYYCWFATWPGDSNYTEGPYTDGSSTECFSITQPTSVLTTLHETNSSGTDVSPAHNGTTLTIDTNGYVVDYATVSPSSATGSVAFRYYANATACNADTAGSAGTAAGGGAISSGSAHSDTLQLASGTYVFRAFFTGTGLSLNSISDCSEVLTVNQVTSVSTTLHETTSAGADLNPTHNGTSITINAGGYVVDYATVSPSTATGSVAFRYYANATACNADTTGSGGTSAGGGAVSGGSAHSSTLQLTAGTYVFRAFFTGTGLNLNSISDCSETLTVQQFQPGLTTTQTVTIKDSATVTVSGGGNLTGTLHFQPFSDSACSAANSLAAQEDIAVSGASPQTKNATTTVTYSTNGSHPVYWKVSYDSTNPAQQSIAATCSENTALTIAGNG